jgi:hypothetical protein
MADMQFNFWGIQFFRPAPIAQDFSLPVRMGKGCFLQWVTGWIRSEEPRNE